MGISIGTTKKIINLNPSKKKIMKTVITIAAFIASTFPVFSQNNCPSSFKRNNGNGTCGSTGELRLFFPGGCPTDAPLIDSVYTNGEKNLVVFSAPDLSKCGGNNGYISYCILSGNVPPIDVWKIYFHNGDGSYNCTVLNSSVKVQPVKFVSFTSALSGNAVTCSWTTEEEINNDHFELERSFDGSNFKTIAFVFGEGTEKTVRNTYQFNDKAASLQTNNVAYYRVKQVDIDGKFSYSNTILVKLGSNVSKGILVSPNPFVNNLAFNFEAKEKGTAEIRISSFTGQAVVTKSVNVNKGSNNLQLGNLSGLATGVYVAQVSIKGIIVGNQKVVKN